MNVTVVASCQVRARKRLETEFQSSYVTFPEPSLFFAAEQLTQSAETSASFGKSSLRHSRSFRLITSNQKLARGLVNIRTESNRTSQYVMLLSNFRVEHRGAQSSLGDWISSSTGTCPSDTRHETARRIVLRLHRLVAEEKCA